MVLRFSSLKLVAFGYLYICAVLRDLVPFVQFEKREKIPMEECYFSNVAGLKPTTLLKVTLLHGRCSRFLNCANGTKLHNATHKSCQNH